MGAYKTTTITLLNSGMPRTISIILSRKLPDDLNDLKDCKNNLKKIKKDLEALIPPIIFESLQI
jgi:hypothetical protein